MPATFSLNQIVQQLQTQWGGSWEGTTESWGGSGPINYYIGGTPYSSGSAEATYKVSMTPLMVSRAVLAFELWDDLIARDLNQVSTAAFGEIQFEYTSRTYNSSGVLSTNGGTYTGSWATNGGTNQYGTANYSTTRSEVWLNSNWSTHNADNDMYFGGYGFQTYMHEIGHALGLSHPGTYDAGNGGTITYANNAEYTLDNRQYTIMSYFGGYAPGAGWQQDGTYSNWLYSSTPMLDDVAAIQAIYGADMTTRTGDTTYGFHSNAGRDVFDFTIDTNPIVTIWDAGGNDTIDVSGYSANQRVDLHAGTYSDVGGMINNVAIAYNTIIENVIGGSGNDTIIVNTANDTVDGGGGTDSVVFSGVRASYTLTALAGNGVRVVGPDGADTLTNVEKLVFTDQTVNWPAAGQPTIGASATHDFNGDGKSDILWQNDNGLPAIWLMNGTQIAAFGPNLPNPGPTLHAKAAADFNGDGKADILWQDDSAAPAVWLMDNTGAVATSAGLPNSGSSWHVKEAADFNGDGKADILWQNDNGLAAIWYMNGTSIAGFGPNLPNPGSTWHVIAADDFNADGKADILWQNDSGAPMIWLMDNSGVTATSSGLPNSGPAWHLKAAADFNGDGKADVLWQNDNGLPAIWLMNGTSISGFGPNLPNQGTAWHVEEARDFDGDGVADILWQNASGLPEVWMMKDANVAVVGPTLVDPGAHWHLV